jgi:hypothetical protein
MGDDSSLDMCYWIDILGSLSPVYFCCCEASMHFGENLLPLGFHGLGWEGRRCGRKFFSACVKFVIGNGAQLHF